MVTISVVQLNVSRSTPSTSVRMGREVYTSTTPFSASAITRVGLPRDSNAETYSMLNFSWLLESPVATGSEECSDGQCHYPSHRHSGEDGPVDAPATLPQPYSDYRSATDVSG